MALSGCTDCSHPPGSAGTRSQHNAVGARDSSLALPPRGFLNPAVSDCAGGTVSGRCALQRQSSWKMPPISLKEPYVSHPCSVSSLLVPAPHCSHSPGLFFRASSSLAGTSGPLALHFQFLRTYFSPCTFPAPWNMLSHSCFSPLIKTNLWPVSDREYSFHLFTNQDMQTAWSGDLPAVRQLIQYQRRTHTLSLWGPIRGSSCFSTPHVGPWATRSGNRLCSGFRRFSRKVPHT